MYSKEMVLNNCYQELSDVLMDVLKYEFVGVDIECSVIHILNKMIDDCQLMIDEVSPCHTISPPRRPALGPTSMM